MAYLPRPRVDTVASKHWATLLSPSPSPELPSPKSGNASLTSTSSPSSAGPRTGTVSLPPLRTAVPLAKLDTYRRAKDNSVSPIQEMLFKPPTSAQPKSAHTSSPVTDRPQPRTVTPFYFPPQPQHTPSTAGRPVLSRLTTDLYPGTSPLSHLKSPRKRADPGQLNILNRAFARSPYPSTEERDRLSRRLGMTSRSVQIWFQNKRRSVKVQEESIKQRYVTVPY